METLKIDLKTTYGKACRKSVSVAYSRKWKHVFRDFRVRTTGGIRDRGGIAYSVNLVFKFSR